MYDISGKFLCADYGEGETPCFNLFPFRNKYYYYYGGGSFNIEGRWACTDATPIPGCINPAACNYNPDALMDDGSCMYGEDCPDSKSTPSTGTFNCE